MDATKLGVLEYRTAGDGGPVSQRGVAERARLPNAFRPRMWKVVLQLGRKEADKGDPAVSKRYKENNPTILSYLQTLWGTIGCAGIYHPTPQVRKRVFNW